MADEQKHSPLEFACSSLAGVARIRGQVILGLSPESFLI